MQIISCWFTASVRSPKEDLANHLHSGHDIFARLQSSGILLRSSNVYSSFIRSSVCFFLWSDYARLQIYKAGSMALNPLMHFILWEKLIPFACSKTVSLFMLRDSFVFVVKTVYREFVFLVLSWCWMAKCRIPLVENNSSLREFALSQHTLRLPSSAYHYPTKDCHFSKLRNFRATHNKTLCYEYCRDLTDGYRRVNVIPVTTERVLCLRKPRSMYTHQHYSWD